MPPPALARVALAGGAGEALAALPARPGVGQILGPDGHSLLVATASNLRRWAASHLGLGPKRSAPAERARRPKTNLAGIATALAWVETDGAFRQRLAYERLAGHVVPPSSRRDLEPPAFLHLDPAERFPRLSVRALAAGTLYGPFRDRRAAEKAKDALQRLIPLRPCDYGFEPDLALPLGLGCLYAQVRSCAAPCLKRVSEEEYRALATRAAGWLADPSRRADAPPAVPRSVGVATTGRALIVDRGRRSVGLFPVRGGRVLDAAAIEVSPEDVEQAVDRLVWPETATGDDWSWLTAWLRGSRARASFVVVTEAAPLAALRLAVRAALLEPFARSVAGGNVGTTREDA